MGSARRSRAIEDGLVRLAAARTCTEGVSGRVAAAVGCRADIRLALPESPFRQRLRTTVHHQRGPHLRGHEGLMGLALVGQPRRWARGYMQEVEALFWGQRPCHARARQRDQVLDRQHV